jgi:hypothetical protein
VRAAAALDVEQGVRALRGGSLLPLFAVLAGCGELPLPPTVEAGGEPGPAVYIAVGAVQPAGYPATGLATYRLDENGQAALSLSPDFTVPPVPRLSVFLSNSPDLTQAVKVAPLGSPTGAQRWTFRVPRGAVWSWVVLWSEELRVVVARALLQPQ